MISAFNTLKPIIERNLKGSPIQYVLCLNDSRTTKVSMATAYSNNPAESLILALSAITQTLEREYNFEREDILDLLAIK